LAGGGEHGRGGIDADDPGSGPAARQRRRRQSAAAAEVIDARGGVERDRSQKIGGGTLPLIAIAVILLRVPAIQDRCPVRRSGDSARRGGSASGRACESSAEYRCGA